MTDLEFYNMKYRESKEYSLPGEKSLYYRVWAQIRDWLTDKEAIFDVGCGPGQMAQVLKNKNYHKAIDYSHVAIEMAKKANPGIDHKFSVKNIYDLTKIDFVDSDTVVCTEVLEHLENDLFLIDLIPERIIFTVPNYMDNARMHKRVYPDLDFIRVRYKNLHILKYVKYPLKKNNLIHIIDACKR